MPTESPEDRLIYLDLDEFGIEATYTPFGGSPTTIQGILDEETQEVDMEGTTIPTTVPIFICREADVPLKVVPSIPQTLNSITISGTDYWIREWRRLEGMVELYLSRKDG